MSQNTNFAVVVPCYNEEKVIPFFEQELRQFLKLCESNTPSVRVDFWIVDNNSTDRSKHLLQQMASRFPDAKINVMSCSKQGYGAALKEGFSQCFNYKYTAFLDLDNTYPMSSLLEMYQKCEDCDLDIIFGARLHSQSQIGVVRKVGNSLYAGLLKIILGSQLSDVCSGMRMFKSEKIVEIVKLNEDGLSFSIQLTSYAILNKWKIYEIPIDYRDRVGNSKLSVVADGFKFLFTCLKVSLFSKRGK